MTGDRGATTSLLPSTGGELALLVVADGPPIVAPLAANRELRIGRGSGADITIDDASLSRAHAVFRVRDGAVEVEDLGSSNGTTIRGARITGATRVEVGEAIQLGTVLVVV
ncbi:MAG: FHA domain-containing protein, partial [Kofleriaceae bacterium]